MSNKRLQEKAIGIYDKIRHDLYLCRPDMDVSGNKYNSHLLLGLLTQLNNGTQIVYGPYGGGKTSSSMYLNSIFYGLPLKVIRSAVVRGNPGITQEKSIARPDYGELNKGEEEVRWQKFCLIPPKIWDELPRTPEGVQSITLAGIEEGSWAYLNQHIFEGRRPFYATANFADRGSYSIIPALMDRFDIATVVGFPGLLNSRAISRRYNKEQELILEDENLSNEAEKILLGRSSYLDIHKNLQEVRRQFLKNLSEKGIPALTDQEKAEINTQINQIAVSSQAEAYCTLLTAELNIPSRGEYLRSFASQCPESRRLDQVLVRYGQSLAWLQKRDHVTLEDVLKIAPYALWHRVDWKDEVRGKFADYPGNDLDLMIAKAMLGDGSKGYSGLKQRLQENAPKMEEFRKLVADEKKDEAEQLLRAITINDKTHPYFWDMKQELDDM